MYSQPQVCQQKELGQNLASLMARVTYVYVFACMLSPFNARTQCLAAEIEFSQREEGMYSYGISTGFSMIGFNKITAFLDMAIITPVHRINMALPTNVITPKLLLVLLWIQYSPSGQWCRKQVRESLIAGWCCSTNLSLFGAISSTGLHVASQQNNLANNLLLATKCRNEGQILRTEVRGKCRHFFPNSIWLGSCPPISTPIGICSNL